jgi:exodeoxyribonuclease VII small subunit
VTQPSPSHNAPPPAPGVPPTFEQAVQALEKIIERIESGEIGLEQSITEYERGVALIKRCREVLDRAEQRVEELTGQMQAGSPPSSAAPAAPQGRGPAPESPF